MKSKFDTSKTKLFYLFLRIFQRFLESSIENEMQNKRLVQEQNSNLCVCYTCKMKSFSILHSNYFLICRFYKASHLPFLYIFVLVNLRKLNNLNNFIFSDKKKLILFKRPTIRSKLCKVIQKYFSIKYSKLSIL